MAAIPEQLQLHKPPHQPDYTRMAVGCTSLGSLTGTQVTLSNARLGSEFTSTAALSSIGTLTASAYNCPCYASLYHTAQQNVGNLGTQARIRLDNVRYNQGCTVTTGTQPSIQVPVAGWYRLQLVMAIPALATDGTNGTGKYNLYFNTGTNTNQCENGTANGIEVYDRNTVDNELRTMTTMYYAAANTALTCRVYQAVDGTAKNFDFGSVAFYTEFTVAYIGS